MERDQVTGLNLDPWRQSLTSFVTLRLYTQKATVSRLTARNSGRFSAPAKRDSSRALRTVPQRIRPQTGYYNCAAEEAAALMESQANNHPFFDGNKCVAFAAHTRFS